MVIEKETTNVSLIHLPDTFFFRQEKIVEDKPQSIVWRISFF